MAAYSGFPRAYSSRPSTLAPSGNSAALPRIGSAKPARPSNMRTIFFGSILFLPPARSVEYAGDRRRSPASPIRPAGLPGSRALFRRLQGDDRQLALHVLG